MVEWIINNFPITVIGALTLIQVAPIKVNPWSKLAEIIQSLLGITEINNRLSRMERDADEKECFELRRGILNFANSCRNKCYHTKTEFEDVARRYARYMKICENREFENHFLEEEWLYIKEILKKCQRENNFLEEVNRREEQEEEKARWV